MKKSHLQNHDSIYQKKKFKELVILKQKMSGTKSSIDKLKEKFDINKLDIFANIKKQYMEQMSPDQIKAYEDFGKKFHEGIDFTKENPDDKNHSKVICLEECLANIIAQLKSGLHPSYIEENEESLLIAHYGQDWFKKFGYESKSMM